MGVVADEWEGKEEEEEDGEEEEVIKGEGMWGDETVPIVVFVETNNREGSKERALRLGGGSVNKSSRKMSSSFSYLTSPSSIPASPSFPFSFFFSFSRVTLITVDKELNDNDVL
jgi:hypothetical protein